MAMSDNVLTEAELDRIWERLSVLSDVEHTNQILTDLLALSRHTEALQQRLNAAEQRAERYREAMDAAHKDLHTGRTSVGPWMPDEPAYQRASRLLLACNDAQIKLMDALTPTEETP